MSIIYYLINKAAIDIKTMNELSLIKTEVKELINKKMLKELDLLNSKFVPNNIREYIFENISSKISFITSINNKKIVLDFYLT